MIFNDPLLKNANNDLKRSFNHLHTLKQINYNVIEELKKDNNPKTNIRNLFRYEIKNGQVSKYNYSPRNQYSDKLFILDRAKTIMDMLKTTIYHVKKHYNQDTPDTTIFVWFGENPPFHIKNFEDFPFFVYAKPKNFKLPIIPDNSYYKSEILINNTNKTYNWDQTKKIISSECKDTKKYDKFFFTGMDTTRARKRGRLRGKLNEYSSITTTIPMEIKLITVDQYVTYKDFCKYRFLLNLPGASPWSWRKKYIILMNSVVIDIDYKKKYYPNDYGDDYTIQFSDFFLPSKDYVKIHYNNYEISDKGSYSKEEFENLISKVDDLNRKEFSNLIDKLEFIYNDYHKNPEKYHNQSRKAKKNMLKLTNDIVYKYIHNCIVSNSTI